MSRSKKKYAPGHVLAAAGHLIDVQQLAILMVAGEPFCIACGCSENDPCPEGCGWVDGATYCGFEVALCTACRDRANKLQKAAQE